MPSSDFQSAITWYDSHASDCALAWDDHFAPEQLSTFVSMLPKTAKVLDAGCGTGRYTRLFHDSGFEVVGIDISQGMIDLAVKKHPNLHFIHGDFLHLNFPSESFDGVWAHNSLIHFESLDDIKQALSEFKRVLKTGGILHLLLTAQDGNNQTGIVKDELHPNGIFYRFFTHIEINQLIESIHYKILVMEIFDESERYPHGKSGSKWIHVLAQE